MFNSFYSYKEENILDQISFDDSVFAGVDKLLEVNSYKDLRVAYSQYDENIAEHYYFLESYGEIKFSEDEILLVELENIKFILVDLLGGQFAIVVRSVDVKKANELLED